MSAIFGSPYVFFPPGIRPNSQNTLPTFIENVKRYAKNAQCWRSGNEEHFPRRRPSFQGLVRGGSVLEREFRPDSHVEVASEDRLGDVRPAKAAFAGISDVVPQRDRKSTRLNSSHVSI